jgi:hypothetical protein
MTKNKARVVGLDVHPDSFAGAVVEGRDPASAVVSSTSTRVELERLEHWALRHTCTEDTLVLEASGNAFAVAARLRAIGREVEILDSHRAGKVGKVYCIAWLGVRSVISIGLRPCGQTIIWWRDAGGVNHLSGAKVVFHVIGWAVSPAGFYYDRSVIVRKSPLLDERAVRVSLKVFDRAIAEANSQHGVHRFAVVVPCGVARPSDQSSWRDMRMHAPAKRSPHLGMAIGKSDFDVTDVDLVVAPLARHVDDRHAGWLCSGRVRKSAQYQEQINKGPLHASARTSNEKEISHGAVQ